MKFIVLLLLLLPFTAGATTIEQSWPVMTIGKRIDGVCVPIDGVSKSTAEHYVIEKALRLGAGDYCVIRPDASVYVIDSGEVVPEPEPEPEDPPETPVASGPMDARFAALVQSPYVHDFLAMNKASEVCENTRPCVNKGLPNAHISYDPAENAFKVDTKGESDISSTWQVRRYFPQLDPVDTSIKKVAFQWEFKYGEGYLSTGLLHNYKAFQLSNSTEGLMFEYQHRFRETDATAVALPTNRYYRTTAYSESHDQDPFSSWGPALSRVNGANMDNWQPGGDSAADRREAPFSLSQHLLDNTYPFLIRVNSWTRQTTEFQFDNNEMRVCIWLSDEATPPTLVLASVREPGKCFLLSSDLTKHRIQFQNWWLEMNSSQDGAVPNLISWHKNFVVYKNASIPLE